MARVHLLGEKKGFREVGVIEDVWSRGSWSVSAIKGFGRESPESVMRAMQFAAVFNAAREAVPMVPRGGREERGAFLATFGFVLGGSVAEAILEGCWPKREDGAVSVSQSGGLDGQERKVPEAERV